MVKETQVQVSYRLYKSVKAWLDKKAKEDDRSSNYLLNQMLKKQMEQEQSLQQENP